MESSSCSALVESTSDGMKGFARLPGLDNIPEDLLKEAFKTFKANAEGPQSPSDYWVEDDRRTDHIDLSAHQETPFTVPEHLLGAAQLPTSLPSTEQPELLPTEELPAPPLTESPVWLPDLNVDLEFSQWFLPTAPAVGRPTTEPAVVGEDLNAEQQPCEQPTSLTSLTHAELEASLQQMDTPPELAELLATEPPTGEEFERHLRQLQIPLYSDYGGADTVGDGTGGSPQFWWFG